MQEKKAPPKNGKGRKVIYDGEREALKKELESAKTNPSQSETFKTVRKYFLGFNPQ